jgi:hypothetical protein
MKVRSALVLALFGLAACNDDATMPGSGSLSREEAIMIAAAVTGNVETTSANTPVGAQNGVYFDPITFNQQLQASHPCPRGGTATLRWDATLVIDTAQHTIELDVEGAHTPAACAFMHEGTTITIDGDPRLDFDAHLALANHVPSEPYTANIDGAFTWSASDGRSGRCTVAYQEVTDFAARQRTREGSVCGHTVQETLTWN